MKKIFNIETFLGRIVITIFGKNFSIRTKDDNLEFYKKAKKHNYDITTLPKNNGIVRQVQLANMKILEELDYVCNAHNLKYWLAGGSMLGAIRHNGFIPWDDDIDTEMLREDYDKLAEVFNSTTRDKDLSIELYRNGWKNRKCMCFYKIKHKKIPFLFVDIFPMETYHSKLNTEEKAALNNKIINLKTALNSSDESLTLDSMLLLEKIKKITKKDILEDKENKEDEPTLFWGLDFPHIWKNWTFDNETFFPLKKVKFEGKSFNCIANPESYLTQLYGNYMDYPKKIQFAHCASIKISKKEYELLNEFIKGCEL